ncbi:MAG: O-antigen ligase family protein [Candidatus Aminicenantaceae bacterium]
MRLDLQDPKFLTALVILAVFIISIFTGQIITGYSYKVVIALILGSLIIVVTLVNTDAALIILIFSMLLSPEIGAGQVPGREIVIRLDDFLLALIIFTWLAKTAVNKGLTLFIKTPINKPIVVYILICVIATLRGTVLGYVDLAKGFFYVARYTEYFLLYILVANHIHSRKQVKFFLNAFFITCAIVSVYGMLQIPSGARVTAPFEGEVGEPNTFGGYLLFVFCVAIGISLQKVSRKMRLTLAGLCILIFLPFLYTLSRASYLAVVFSYIALIILSKKKAVLVAVLAAVILTGAVLKPEAIFSRVQYTFTQQQERLARFGTVYLDESASARIFSWKDSLNAWKKHPVLGRGVTGFIFIDGQYIRTLPELGAIGFAVLLWLLWSIFKHSLNIHKKMEDELYKGLTMGYIAGFVGLVVHALASNTFIIIRIMEPFWFITGIVMMLPALNEDKIET